MKIIRKIVYPITIILFIFITVCLIYTKNKLDNNKYDNVIVNQDIVKEDVEKDLEEDIVKYSIDVKGAVNNPGVYIVDSNLVVNDVINVAGGLREDADTSFINLAKKIEDEMVIIIYTKEEVKNSNVVDTVIKIVEKECVCPNIKNDGCLNTEIDNTINNGNGLININTASLEQLQEIDGIGEGKAKKIIEYREEKGKFTSIEDIMNVDGIGEKLYETIKAYITT